MRAGKGLLAVLGVLLLAGSASATSVTNGDFSAGLSGWSIVGPVSDGGGFALMAEDPVFILTSLGQAFTIPAGAVSLSFDHAMASLPGGPGGSPFPDAFAASLLDPVTFDPILSTPGFPDYFYRDSGGLIDFDPAIVTLVGDRVTLDLTSVAGGANALLVFDLVGADNGLMTTVAVDNIKMEVIPEPLTVVVIPSALVGLAAYLRRRRAQG